MPSEVISRADTFDVYILNTMLEHEDYQHRVAEAKQGKGPMPTTLSQGEMQDMIKRAKEL